MVEEKRERGYFKRNRETDKAKKKREERNLNVPAGGILMA